MMAQHAYVIIGNGIAGATAAEVLRTEDGAAEITVLADDPCPVFYRPALKDYLGGKIREEKLWARPISFYPDRQVRFITERVVSIQPAEHSVQLQSGRRMAYSRLLLAHGARATSLTCPGVHLMGVTTLRTVADYQRVLARLNTTRRIVVVGSGTLALESIETLRHRGYEVTHLLRKRALWSEVLDPVASDLVLQQEKRDGVDIRTDQEIAEIRGKDGHVTGVVTTAGQHIACEVVLLGIGIEPHIDFVKSAGIACGRGVKVDGAMHTNMADIYAAGDLIETTDPLTRKARVIGQWYPSIQQARAAAYSMLEVLDREHSFRFGNFYNASFLYGLEFASVGLSTAPKGERGYQEIAADPQPRHYQKVILKDGVPVGMLALGDRSTVLAYKRAVDHQVNLSAVAAQLFAPGFNLRAWLDKQGVPSPLLGVSREGAVAIGRVAYATRAQRSPASPQNTPGAIQEAHLIPAPNLALSPPLKAVYLSQTQVTTIGHHEGSSLMINHDTIAPRHAEISYANGGYVLRDLGSRHGTAVNTILVGPNSITRLKPSDQITFGGVPFTLEVHQVDPSSSILLGQGLKQEPFIPSPTGPGTTSPPAVKNKRAEGGTAAAQVPPAPAQGQPVLQDDGRFFLPGAADPLPPDASALIHKGATLVAILNGKPLLFPLPAHQRITIGRDAKNDLVLPDMSVSRKHAEVFPGPDGIYIRDLQSANGIRVNHYKISTAYRLAHEAHIAVGNVSVYFFKYQGQALRGQSNVPLVVSTPAVQGTSQAAPPGAATEAKAKTLSCRQCGEELPAQARFCPRCGSPQ